MGLRPGWRRRRVDDADAAALGPGRGRPTVSRACDPTGRARCRPRRDELRPSASTGEAGMNAGRVSAQDVERLQGRIASEQEAAQGLASPAF